ncbi:hypothetical protein DFH07DRAFT_837915 [Mycena maculata]|uniref:Uncharacterized protein n=1 Tax=Mycena maculata TaxID=230809 RepID=A0AAD7IGG8_9AGAR|nr:hypothetical protein DFH07DRAFT_837915 [Mycena maculata]
MLSPGKIRRSLQSSVLIRVWTIRSLAAFNAAILAFGIAYLNLPEALIAFFTLSHHIFVLFKPWNVKVDIGLVIVEIIVSLVNLILFGGLLSPMEFSPHLISSHCVSRFTFDCQGADAERWISSVDATHHRDDDTRNGRFCLDAASRSSGGNRAPLSAPEHSFSSVYAL